jgi:hypothetical protein
MSTVSPARTSLRRISSSLWRLTLRIVTPPTSAVSSFATGVSTPVLPTRTSIARTIVVPWRGANLKATAQRGWCPVLPRRTCASRASTFTTTPSASYSSVSRSRSIRSPYATTASMSRARWFRGLTGKPASRSVASVSQCDSKSAAVE